MRTQDELERIWKDIHQGAYGNDPSVIKPRKVVEDEEEHVMSIPNIDGIGVEEYRRKPGEPWESVPYVGEEQSFL